VSAQRVRSIDAIVFDVLLIAFAATIVISAFGIGEKSRMIPLLVGVPTLIALGVVLARDLRGTVPEAPPETGEPRELATADVHDLWQAAVHELEEDDQIPDTPEARRRQLWFALWAIAVVALAAVTSLMIAVPLGLLAILGLGGIGWVRSAVITAATCGVLYCLFVLFLEVRF
jgi:Tripartite tricarboxylate transporter TctB family